MEPLGAEECHSSESGWTMYIGSQIDDNDDGDNHKSDDDEHCTQARPQDGYDDASDDSMASDASSGPSHHGFAEYDGKNKYCLEKKANKRQEKVMMEGKKVVEKKGKVFVDSKGKSQVQEVRKKYCAGGKRK